MFSRSRLQTSVNLPPLNTSTLRSTGKSQIPLGTRILGRSSFSLRFASSAVPFIDPRLLASNSFDLLFGTQSPLGVAEYLIHFDSAQPLDVTTPMLRNVTARSFELSFITTAPTGPLIDGPHWTGAMSGDFTPVPEPGTLVLLGTGLAVAGVRRYRQKP